MILFSASLWFLAKVVLLGVCVHVCVAVCWKFLDEYELQQIHNLLIALVFSFLRIQIWLIDLGGRPYL